MKPPSFGRNLSSLILFLGCQLIVSQLQAFTLRTLPENPTAGEGFLLQIKGNPENKYQVLFEHKIYKPFPVSKGVWKILLPLGIKTAGERELVVEKTSPAEPEEKHSSLVNVTPREIRTVFLGKASRNMRKAQPSISKQQKKVLAAINHRDSKKYWNQPFYGPLRGEITTEFGLKRDLETYSSYHWGIDLDAPEGTPVQAANSGRVILSGRNFNIYGNLLILDHGQGVVSCYFHLSKIFKQAGDTVKQDEVIAEVGNTGWSTGPHLHFGVYLQGKPVDPTWIISFTESKLFAGDSGT
ncbi:MAG: M23 family metallopeptidase [Candidatus Ratteibacteria bacterium]|jgi:murein DD-endopeptidase MepM/ murein hydrolase activator NlpD